MENTIDNFRSDKGFGITTLLCLVFGILGVHRFYVGKTTTGIIQLALLGGLGIWTLFDFVKIITGNFKDGYGLYIQHQHTV